MGPAAKHRLAIAAAVVVAVACYELFVTDLMYHRRYGERVGDYYAQDVTISAGQALAVLQVPKVGLNTIVGEGAAPSVLRGGAGHLPDTALPGQQGRIVLLGHHRRFGGTFGKIGELKEGDELFLQPRGGSPTRYLVDEVVTSSKAEAEVLLAESDGNVLTLVTSAPGIFSTRRVMVRATADDDAALVTGTARASDSIDLGSTDLADAARVLVWLAAVGGLIYAIVSYLNRRAVTVASVTLAVPLLLLAILQLMLAIDSIAPSTL